MAQVVNFFQWPLNSVREAVGYTSNKDDAEKKIELPSLPARKFNWFNMTNDDIAWLMRYCGQSVLMDYKTDESTSSPSSKGSPSGWGSLRSALKENEDVSK
jgi:hypothetical protein